METTGEVDSSDSLGFGSDEDAVAALDRLSRIALKNGLYDRNVMPEGGQMSEPGINDFAILALFLPFSCNQKPQSGANRRKAKASASR